MRKYIKNILSRNSIDYMDSYEKKYNDISFSFDFNTKPKYYVYLSKKSFNSCSMTNLIKNFYVYHPNDFYQIKTRKSRKLIYYLVLLSIYKYINYQ